MNVNNGNTKRFNQNKVISVGLTSDILCSNFLLFFFFLFSSAIPANKKSKCQIENEQTNNLFGKNILNR